MIYVSSRRDASLANVSRNWSNLGQTLRIGIILIVSISVLIGIGFYFGTGGAGSGGAGGGNAPSFTLTDTDGNNFSLSDFHDKVVILDLMGTECPPCQNEISQLKEIKQEFGNDLSILSISVAYYDSNQTLTDFKQEYDVNWRFAIDTDNLTTKYDVKYIPKLVIIGKNGNIQFQHTGSTSSDTLKEEINELL